MKKLLTLLLIFASVASFSQDKTLILASDIWPPFTNYDTKKTFATDLVAEALRRIGQESRTEIIQFGELLDGIKTGKYNGSSALWKNPERTEFMLFSEPYLYNQLIIVGIKGSDVSHESYSDLKGKKIGIVKNYSYVTKEDDIRDIEFISGESDQANLERLLLGQIDYMLVDALLIQYLLKFQVNDVTEYLEIGNKPLVIKPLHFVLGKNAENAELILSAFNEEIKKMVADGTYNKILELNWIQADIDGDGQLEMILSGKTAGKEAPRNVYGIDSSNGKKGDAQKYYVDGQTYNGWDKVPQQYKNEIVMGSQSVEGMGVKLNFK